MINFPSLLNDEKAGSSHLKVTISYLLVDITTGKVPFLRVFTSFFARFPYEKLHTEIDQFSSIDVFLLAVQEMIDNFTLSIFSKPDSSLNRVETKLASNRVFSLSNFSYKLHLFVEAHTIFGMKM